MKHLITIILLLVASLAIGQEPTKPAKEQCIALTTKGVQCKKTATEGQAKCAIHSDNAIRCGAPTASGKACRMMVKAAGDKCRFHRPPTQ